MAMHILFFAYIVLWFLGTERSDDRTGQLAPGPILHIGKTGATALNSIRKCQLERTASLNMFRSLTFPLLFCAEQEPPLFYSSGTLCPDSCPGLIVKSGLAE